MTANNDNVTDITDALEPAAPERESDAMRIQRLGLVAYNKLAYKYRLLVNNDTGGEPVLAQAFAPGVLRCVTRADVLYCDLIKGWGAELTPPRVKSELEPRWFAEMRTRQQTIMEYAAVKPFRFKSDVSTGWAWQRLAFDPLPDAPCPPQFAELMAITTPEEALSVKLFIGSLFDHKSSRHQYLYLHGEGGAGKSTLIAAMFAMFASRGCRTMKGDTLDRPHASAGLEGVRLLAFPDCNRPSLPSTGIFKELTGDDVVSIDPKNRDMRNITVHCKVVISSNDAPGLVGGKADERRILPVKFERLESTSDDAWKEAFIASAPQIAQHCIDVYQKWRLTNPKAEIPQSSAAMDVVRDNSVYATAEDFVNRIFYFEDPNAFIRASVLVDTIRRYAQGDDRLAKQMRKAVLARKTVIDTVKRFGKTTAKGWKGLQVRAQIDMDNPEDIEPVQLAAG